MLLRLLKLLKAVFFFFLNLNLYSARVQLGTEAVTFVKTYYAYEVRVGGGSQRELAMGVV